MSILLRRMDVELLEKLCEAAIRSGHTQTSIEGWALALRLRLELGAQEEVWLSGEESNVVT